MRFVVVISFLLSNGHWTAAFEIRQPTLAACEAFGMAIADSMARTSPDVVQTKWECRDVTA